MGTTLDRLVDSRTRNVGNRDGAANSFLLAAGGGFALVRILARNIATLHRG